MSGLFSDDDDNAVEKLKRAGIAADKTIFTAPERRSDDATAPVRPVLFHPPDRRHDPPTPNETVRDGFRDPRMQMPAEELDEDLKRELDRLKSEGRADQEALRGIGIEQLKREFGRRGVDPRPLRDEMPTDELDEDLKRELERLKREGKGDQEALRRIGIEQLKRGFWRRGIDPRPLRGE
jgi:hypothetical protein